MLHLRLPIFLCAASLLLSGCAFLGAKPGVGGAVSWWRVPGWKQDHHAEAWPALAQTCNSRVGATDSWRAVCNAAQALATPNDDQAREFFERWFEPHRVVTQDGGREGLITGYYEPVLQGSLTRSERFRFPVYTRPDDLLTIDLAGVYPELRGKPLRGRLQGRKVVPYADRKEIENQPRGVIGSELVWVDDPIALFFLQIQGAGRIVLPDGSQMAVGYLDQNGYPYVPIGRCLIERGILKPEDITLQSIRAWLSAHPERQNEIFNCNPSYIFFQRRELATDVGPIGSLQVPLTPLRSAAVDPNFIALGSPVWLATDDPLTQTHLRRLVFAQDTGGAIRGPARMDLFCGQGVTGETLAGQMKQNGKLFVLVPRAGTI